jgi:hypothetical protein
MFADGKCEAPLSWLLFGRFGGALVLDSSFCLWNVAESKFAGIAGPKAIGASIAEYFWGMLVTIPFLQMPTFFRFSLSGPRQLSLEEARAYINDIVHESQLLPDVKAQLFQRIQRAKSVHAIGRALDDARE